MKMEGNGPNGSKKLKLSRTILTNDGIAETVLQFPMEY